MKLLTKTIILLIIAGIIALIATQKSIQYTVMDFLSRNIPFFSYFKEQVSSGTLVGVAAYTFFANIPALPSIPSEAYAIFSYTKGSNIFGIAAVVAGVNVIFASIYYFIGYLLGPEIIEKITKKIIKQSESFEIFAQISLFILTLFPIPFISSLTPILILFLGAYRVGFKKVVIIVASATSLKFLSILLLYKYYTPLIEKYISSTNLF